MNIPQKVVVVVSIILFLIAGLFPNFNWVTVTEGEPTYSDKGKSFLFLPPTDNRSYPSYQIDYRRIMLEWTLISVPAVLLFVVLKRK